MKNAEEPKLIIIFLITGNIETKTLINEIIHNHHINLSNH